MMPNQLDREITWAELQEIAELIKKLTPKEKERIRYMLQGAVMISEAANMTQISEAANMTQAAAV